MTAKSRFPTIRYLFLSGIAIPAALMSSAAFASPSSAAAKRCYHVSVSYLTHHHDRGHWKHSACMTGEGKFVFSHKESHGWPVVNLVAEINDDDTRSHMMKTGFSLSVSPVKGRRGDAYEIRFSKTRRIQFQSASGSGDVQRQWLRKAGYMTLGDMEILRIGPKDKATVSLPGSRWGDVKIRIRVNATPPRKTPDRDDLDPDDSRP